MYKEISKNLAAKGALVLVNDEGNLVQRKATKAFAHRNGRYSEWGVIFDSPLSDGSVGVVYSLIKEVVS